jgi:hypothetical protein
MKKTLAALLILAVLLSFGVRAAFARGLLTLLEVRNDAGGGVLFVFSFSGDFSKSDFKGGFAVFGDRKYPLDCSMVEEGILQCTAAKALGGKEIMIHLAGFLFWTYVPAAHVSDGSELVMYCNDVYDYFDLYDEEEEFLGYFWLPFEEDCYEYPAAYGDVIYVYNPYYSGTFDYEFMPGSPPLGCVENTISESAFFYNGGCPDVLFAQ